jgi:hypothetical protein
MTDDKDKDKKKEKDNKKEKDKKKEKSNIIRGPWSDSKTDQISQEIMEEIVRIQNEDKKKPNLKTKIKPIEERIMLAMIEYFNHATTNATKLKQLDEMNNVKTRMLAALKLENKQLRGDLDKSTVHIRELRRDNKILSEDNDKNK